LEKHPQLFKLITEGNEFAFRAGLLVEKCLDGGELGDFYRSAGVFFELHPDSFLKIVAVEDISESNIKSMLTMLPLGTVDNIDRQVAVIQKRKALLEQIKDRSLTEIRDIGLSFLRQQEELLLNTRTRSDSRSNQSKSLKDK